MTTTAITTRHTESICPSWCAGHTEVYQGWETLTATGRKIRQHSPAEYPIIGGIAVIVAQVEHEDTGMNAPTVMVDADDNAPDHELSEADAHELGLALVRAAERIRRERAL